MGTHLEKGIPKNQPEGKTNSPEKFFALGGPVAQSAQGYEVTCGTQAGSFPAGRQLNFQRFNPKNPGSQWDWDLV